MADDSKTPSSPLPEGPDARGSVGKRWLAFGLMWLGALILRLLIATLRVRVELPRQVRERTSPAAFIFVFWHNRLLLVPWVWQRFLQKKGRPQGLGLTSLSSDGEWVALLLERFNIGAVRGSAKRRGAGAVRELAGWLKRGHDIGITPDGSRGPCYEIKPGLVLLAQLSGCEILPMSFEFSNAWRLRSWDRFFIPKPFSTVRFIVGEPCAVRRTKTPTEFEAERLRCEGIMRAQVQEA